MLHLIYGSSVKVLLFYISVYSYLSIMQYELHKVRLHKIKTSLAAKGIVS